MATFSRGLQIVAEQVFLKISQTGCLSIGRLFFFLLFLKKSLPIEKRFNLNVISIPDSSAPVVGPSRRRRGRSAPDLGTRLSETAWLPARPSFRARSELGNYPLVGGRGSPIPHLMTRRRTIQIDSAILRQQLRLRKCTLENQDKCSTIDRAFFKNVEVAESACASVKNCVFQDRRTYLGRTNRHKLATFSTQTDLCT